MGRNMNQIARAINAERKMGDDPDFERLKLEELKEIRSMIEAIELGIFELIDARARDWGSAPSQYSVVDGIHSTKSNAI